VTGIVERDRSSAKLQDWTEAQAIPTVAIVALNAKPGVASLNCPAGSRPICARRSMRGSAAT
jgi:membrane fusion protein (multidrug efflux system)